MKRIVCIICFISAVYSLKAQSPYTDPTWQNVMQDEFDTLGLRTYLWERYWPWWQDSTELCSGVSQRVPATYTRNNNNFIFDTVGTGSVIINIKKESSPYREEVWYWDSTFNLNVDSIDFNYTMGMLRSKLRYKYGYFECRFKIPQYGSGTQTKGISPGFWMYGNNSDSADYSLQNIWAEIDAAEILSGKSVDGTNHNCTSSNIHYQKCNTTSTNPSCIASDNVAIHDFYNEQNSSETPNCTSLNFNTYHTFSIEWDSLNIKIYLDGVLNLRNINVTKPWDMTPMSLIANFIVPACNFSPYGDSLGAGNVNPYNMQIDYIKVWQLKCDCANQLSIANINLGTYNSKIYKSIQITGTSSTTLNSGDNLTLRANDYIQIDKEFTVNAGASCLLLPTPCTVSYSTNASYITGPPPEEFNVSRRIQQ